MENKGDIRAAYALADRVQQLEAALREARDALEYVTQRKWVAETPQASSWIKEFCEVADKALTTINAVLGEKAGA